MRTSQGMTKAHLIKTSQQDSQQELYLHSALGIGLGFGSDQLCVLC